MSTEEHWNTIFESRPTEELGWYEPEPTTLGLVTAHSTPDDSVIDVGGGDSRLIKALLDRGYSDVTVLDLSDVALERARRRWSASDRPDRSTRRTPDPAHYFGPDVARDIRDHNRLPLGSRHSEDDPIQHDHP